MWVFRIQEISFTRPFLFDLLTAPRTNFANIAHRYVKHRKFICETDFVTNRAGPTSGKIAPELTRIEITHGDEVVKKAQTCIESNLDKNFPLII